MTEPQSGRSLRTRGLVLLAIAGAALMGAAMLPFAGAPIGWSEALLLIALPCAVGGLIRRYARD